MSTSFLNLTGDEQQKTLGQLICSAAVTNGTVPAQVVYLAVINIFLSITAILENTLILLALHKESSLHPPSKLLLRSLAITDLCVGLIAQPVYASYQISLAQGHWSVCRFKFDISFLAGYILCSMSLWTISAISVDRLLALSLGIRYRQVVTLKRANILVFSFWVVSLGAAGIYFWNYLLTTSYCYILISVCMGTSVVSYTKIFLVLRRQQTHVENQSKEKQTISPLNMARYKKAVTSALWLQAALVICYMPHGVVEALLTFFGTTSYFVLARNFTASLVFTNSSLNPILYCWKIKEVRQSVKGTVQQLYSLLRSPFSSRVESTNSD
ncbi:adenosine receptor A3-like [Pocillopora damicornis]|uniref:adenosine receptor A3-like n=1 Tax=Pocillopora damicornis TaxID=46731 RepID=UPI000F54EFDB|nr:adenosine receptor A3-like [Pocillopora damicornis]